MIHYQTKANTTLYHNGHWLIDPNGSFVGFKSLITGWVYHIEVIDPDDEDAARGEWAFGKPARDGHLYAEDVRISHTVEANCGWNDYEEAQVDDIELDGYPLDFEDDYTKDRIIDVLWETYQRDSA